MLTSLMEAGGPHSDHQDKLMLFGRLVGSWTVKSYWYDQQKVTSEAEGEWHFAWILGGRGVQDILFRKDSPLDTYGTTLRCYDSKNDVWQVSWMQPSGGEFVHLLGRQDGPDIVQQGEGAVQERLERWRFTDIMNDSFLWWGEVSFDKGKTWTLEQKMEANRMV